MKNLLEYDALPDLKKISLLTEVVWGRKDKITPLWMGRTLSNYIPGSTLTVLNTGHNPHRENPKELVAIINKFVAR